MILLSVFVMVVNSDEGATEGEYLTKSDEDAVVDFANRCSAESRYE